MTTPLQLEGWRFRWPLDESPISRAIIHTLRESQSALAPRLPCPTFGRKPAPSGRAFYFMRDTADPPATSRTQVER